VKAANKFDQSGLIERLEERPVHGLQVNRIFARHRAIESNTAAEG